jgi:hypothetical protein
MEDMAMAGQWRGPDLSEDELREVERKQEEHRTKQPYATELDNRELEHSHKEDRPTRRDDEGTAPDAREP